MKKNTLKVIFGPITILLGLWAAFYIIDILAIPKFKTGKGEDLIAAIIYSFLVPIISASLIIFGYYATVGEYSDEKI